MDKTLIIAEAGVNHGGDLKTAHKMIELANASGADIVKFQMYNPLKVLGPKSPFLRYAQSCQFTKRQHEELKSHCDAAGIEYLVSVFDVADLPWALRLCKRVKIATRMNGDAEFRKAAIASGKQILVSTTEPVAMYSDKFVYLYCVPKYPTKPTEYSPAFLQSCEGFSTHCPNISPALLAVSKGCKVVEAHVTTSRELEGCDMSSSWTFDELKQFVGIVRTWELYR